MKFNLLVHKHTSSNRSSPDLIASYILFLIQDCYCKSDSLTISGVVGITWDIFASAFMDKCESVCGRRSQICDVISLLQISETLLMFAANFYIVAMFATFHNFCVTSRFTSIVRYCSLFKYTLT